MPRQSLEEKLARLKELEAEPCSENAIREIRQALSGAGGALAAKAAQAAARMNLRDLAPELIAVFNRCLKNPVKSDPGCRAKLAVVEALNALDHYEADVFLRGIRHIQLEPSYGPPVDTADHLRAACALGLYRLGYSGLLFELVSLLVDLEPVARRTAVQILADMGQQSCELLLRLKALQGDKQPEVLGDCFSGLIAMAPSRSLRFLEPFLSAGDPAVAEEAALAIGNSRLQEAFTLLREYRDRNVSPGSKRRLLLPIALTRCEAAYALLLDVVRDENADNAEAAVEALSIYSDNPERSDRIRDAVRMRDDRAISAAYEKAVTRTNLGR